MRSKIRDYIETAIYAVVTFAAFAFAAAVLCVTGCVLSMVI